MDTTAPASAIATCLASEGVRYLFGMPGGGNNLDVIGACEASGIHFALAHTETGAAIMASAYAELTDTVGACVVTRGPGAASAVNGAAQAQQDRQPLLLFCDTVDEASTPRIAHQNIDQRAMFTPVTKWSTTLGSADSEQVVRDAIHTATTPVRGAVHIDVDPGYGRRHAPPPQPAESGSMSDVARLVAVARRPVILVGVGARSHSAAIRKLVDGTAIPVLMTYKAKGIVPDSGVNAAGTFTGARTDGAVLYEADLILALGLDSVELIPNPWHYQAPVVALTDAQDPYRYFDAEVTVVGPLATLLEQLPQLNDSWPADFATRRREVLDRALLDGPGHWPGIAPWDVVRVVRAAAAANSVATVDAGAHMLVAMPLWKTEEPGQVLISSGLATMGYSVPAAVGASLATADARIYCFVGDGGLAMSLGELETISRLRLPITVVVFNDSTLSLIKAKQKPHGHGGSAAVQYSRTDFAAVAAGMGIPSVTVGVEAELQAALAPNDAGPQLLDVRVHPDTYRHVIDVVRNGVAG
ncbi:MAG: thiamine pyrophosphate-binding protein [Frankiales bacterium]|nr:thiamine pyrophosphate-binding protein [Frankiales bacterium]